MIIDVSYQTATSCHFAYPKVHLIFHQLNLKTVQISRFSGRSFTYKSVWFVVKKNIYYLINYTENFS